MTRAFGALVGYTNPEKSTLLNVLTHAEVNTANQLFATLDPTTRRKQDGGCVYQQSSRTLLQKERCFNA